MTRPFPFLFALLTPKFLTADNGINVARQASINLVLAAGMTFVILTRGIDLAAGSVLGVSAVISVMLSLTPVWTVGAVPLSLAVGALLGAGTGAVVAYGGLPPFIVTLGTFYIYLSLGNVYGEGKTFQGDAMPHALTWLHNTFSIGNVQITYAVVMALVMYLVFGFILAKTAWGRHVYATGDDKEGYRREMVRLIEKASALPSK